MSKGLKLLRVEYIFSILVPCLICIYLNNFDPISQIWLLAGFCFYAITGNTLNDVIDMKNPEEKETLERVNGYQRKEIFIISIASFILGTTCFLNPIIQNPLIAIYLAIIIVLVILYCLIKSLVIINHVILGVSHIFLPWFMLKINAGDFFLHFFPSLILSEWLVLASIAAVAFIGQLLHEMIDGDAFSKLAPKTSQLVIWIASIITLILAVVSFIMTQYLIFFPLIILPIGMMYIFRHPREDLLGRTSLKDIGILLGNLFLAFLIILIIAP